jgi:hypothetical protein
VTAEPELSDELDIRVVSLVCDDDETWQVRAVYDDFNPLEAIGMLVVALAREVSQFVLDGADDDD